MRTAWIAAILGLVAGAALADEPAPAADASETPAAAALAAFVDGTRHAKEARWAQALAAFERAERASPHPITTYNIGACQRALGQYTRARATFRRALAEHEASGATAIPETLLDQTAAFLGQIDELLARVTVRVEPEVAAISVDGAPLTQTDEHSDGLSVYVAGTRPGGPGEIVAARRFVMLADPGAHVLTLTRKGFAPAIVNRTFAPGAGVVLALALDRLPATLQIRSRPADAIATVQHVDVGPTPVDVLRPAGDYRIEIQKEGYLRYETRIHVTPGEQVNVLAPLVVDEPSLLERWWFWTLAGAAVTGAAVVTYVATRPEPDMVREEVSGGSFGYKVRVP